MGDYFGLLNLDIKKQPKGQKLLIVSLEMSNKKLVEKDRRVYVEETCVENGIPGAVFKERVRALNHEKDVVRKRNGTVRIIKVRDTKGLARWSVFDQL